MATQSAKRIRQAAGFDLSFDGSCLIRPGGKAGFMAPSRQYIERDLFELGYTSQCLIERIHSFWLWGDAEDEAREVPRVACELVEEMIVELSHLADYDLGEDFGRSAKEVVSSLSAAWSGYQHQWMGREHQQLLRSIDRADGILLPTAEESLSPLATATWAEYRKELKALLAGLPEGLSIWFDLGGLVAQVLGLDTATREQAQILGELYPIPRLQELLRTVRDGQPALSDLDIELSDRRTSVHGYKNVERVQQKVRRIRKAILDRLASGDVTEDAHEPKSRKGRGKWPITRTEPAVARYLSEHAGAYRELVPLVLQGDAEGFKRFRAKFGATEIARAITNKAGGSEEGSCGKSHVQKTTAYRQCVLPLLKKPPERPVGWQSREEQAVLGDYLRDMQLE